MAVACGTAVSGSAAGPIISAGARTPVIAAGISPTEQARSSAAVNPQGPDTVAGDEQRVSDRMRALRTEAQQLAQEARTLVGDLRQLEIQRDIRVAEATRAEAAVTAARSALQETTDRLAVLEAQQVDERPAFDAQLVDLYKRGRGGYASLLLGATNARDFARAARAATALAELSRRRIDEHRRLVADLRRERASRAASARDLGTREAAARRARADADRAVAARQTLLTQIDSRRDVNARYVGELQVAYDRLQQRISTGTGTAAGATAGATSGAAVIPIAPFRGALVPPVPGRIIGRFGDTSRLGGTAVAQGIDIGSPVDTPVKAVHGGTVAFSGPFAGFGTLVIVNHGADNYSLYGYLGSARVTAGDTVESGTELGRSGTAPDGRPALYFELRIGGRPVDPVQWLRGIP